MRRGPREKRERHFGVTMLKLENMLRRMVAASTSLLEWSFEGFDDGEVEELVEGLEVYSNGGFASRPQEGQNAEAVVAAIGGDSNHLAVIATRDPAAAEAFEAAAGAALGEGETAIFTQSGAHVLITASGDINVTPGGSGLVKIGGDPAALVPLINGVVTGEGVDTYTGLPFSTTGASSAKVLAKK